MHTGLRSTDVLSITVQHLRRPKLVVGESKTKKKLVRPWTGELNHIRGQLLHFCMSSTNLPVQTVDTANTAVELASIKETLSQLLEVVRSSTTSPNADMSSIEQNVELLTPKITNSNSPTTSRTPFPSNTGPSAYELHQMVRYQYLGWCKDDDSESDTLGFFFPVLVIPHDLLNELPFSRESDPQCSRGQVPILWLMCSQNDPIMWGKTSISRINLTVKKDEVTTDWNHLPCDAFDSVSRLRHYLSEFYRPTASLSHDLFPGPLIKY
ncbi:hypothetical protein RCL1_000117 [Eukaryota sp. TZLM3-RCL]